MDIPAAGISTNDTSYSNIAKLLRLPCLRTLFLVASIGTLSAGERFSYSQYAIFPSFFQRDRIS
jgi:hypothetical protein